MANADMLINSNIDVLDLQLPLGKIKVSCSLNPLNDTMKCETNQDGNIGPTYNISIDRPQTSAAPINNSIVQELNCSPYSEMAEIDAANNPVCMPVTCPIGSKVNTDSLGYKGCSFAGDSKVVICPYGYVYDISASGDMVTCNPISLPGKLGNLCPAGYMKSSVNGSSQCIEVARFTSHVYDFKSKKERKIENFSQNGKCNVRY